MGLMSFFRRKALTGSPEFVESLSARRVNTYPLIATPPANAQVRDAWVMAQSAALGYIYKTQPAVRRVIDYIAWNTAQLELKLYERRDDNDREEVGDHAAAQTMRWPNSRTSTKLFLFRAITNYLIYDNSYILKFRGSSGVGPRTLLCVPTHAVGVVGPSFFEPDAYRIWRADGTFFDVDVGDMIHWAGFDPEDPRQGFSKLETLRNELAGDRATQTALVQLTEGGFLGPGHITRPLEAPEWSEKAQERFLEQLAEREKDPKFKPVLEEGMEFHPAAVSPKDAQALESRRFTEEQVAGLFGMKNVPPQTEDEQRQFYMDVLPPLCESFAAVLNLSLLKDEYLDEDEFYFEFDLDEKLAGDERIKTLVNAAGAPVLTRNEARGKLNLPAKDGGDELITPLNVVVGGKPSVGAMPAQNPVGPDQEGGPQSEQEPAAPAQGSSVTLDLEREIREHFRHQKAKRASAKTNGHTRFDTKGQNKSLADRLAKVDPNRDWKTAAEEINKQTQVSPDFSDERAGKLAKALVDQDLLVLSQGVIDQLRSVQLAESLLHGHSRAE